MRTGLVVRCLDWAEAAVSTGFRYAFIAAMLAVALAAVVGAFMLHWAFGLIALWFVALVLASFFDP